MSKQKRRFRRRIQGKVVEGIAMEMPDELKTFIHERQPDSVAVCICPICGAKRYINQAFLDFGKEAKQVAVEGVPPEYKEAAEKLEMLPRHKPCNAIMHVHPLSPENENEVSEQSRKPTTERLAEALSLANAPKEMIDRALGGFYDDFKSPLAAPTVQLVQDARKAGLMDIAKRAMNGDFDAEKWESDEWAKSPEGQATFREFLQGKHS